MESFSLSLYKCSNVGKWRMHVGKYVACTYKCYHQMVIYVRQPLVGGQWTTCLSSWSHLFIVAYGVNMERRLQRWGGGDGVGNIRAASLFSWPQPMWLQSDFQTEADIAGGTICRWRRRLNSGSALGGVDHRLWWRPVEMWWHTRRSQISSFGETDEPI